MAEKINPLDDSAKFNKQVCEGILSLRNGNYSTALDLFSKAISLFPENKEGYLYRSLTYIAKELAETQQENSETLLKQASEELDLSIKRSKKDAELHYYKGLLDLTKHKYIESLQAFTKAIDYADESIARHYFARGFCEASISMIKEAIEDIDITLKLEENHTDAYLIKGKCSYIAGDANTAFMCYQQLILLNKNDPAMHVHAGNLLMASGAFEDAAKAFANADEILETAIAKYQQSKVFN